jgi:hypothetical protein
VDLITPQVHFGVKMTDKELNETQVLPEITPKPSLFGSQTADRSRPFRFLLSRKRYARANSNAAFVHELETAEEPTPAAPLTTYGYLANIQSFKPFCTPDDKSLPKKVR